MKKTINTWKTIEKLAKELNNELDNEDYEIVASLVWDLAFKAILYAAKKKGFSLRRTWPNLKPFLPTLTPPLKKDYTALLKSARDINKDARYAEDEWEFDTDHVQAIAEEVLDLVKDVRQMAP